MDTQPSLGVRGVTELRVGMPLIYASRYWLVERVNAQGVLLRPGSRPTGPAREVPPAEDSVWLDAAELSEIAIRGGFGWLDAPAVEDLRSYTWSDQVRWSARLQVVNVFLTGCTWGYEALAEDDEPVSGLEAEAQTPGNERVLRVQQWLASGSRRAREVAFNLEARHRRESADGSNLAFSMPSRSTILRWVAAVGEGGIWALMDGRAASRGHSGEYEERRARTRQLVEEVLAARTDATSQHSDAWIDRQVCRLAQERGLLLLGRTARRELIALLHQAAGRTPTQRKTAEFNRTRPVRQSNRPFVPGQFQGWDATLGHALGRLHPDMAPVRFTAHASVTIPTGVITAVWATARYSISNVLLMAFDAFSPFFIAPGSAGVHGARLKTLPTEIFLGEGAERLLTGQAPLLKPGVIASNIRCDNASQNQARAMVAMLAHFRITLSPSRVGRKTGNAHAENAMGILAHLFEDMPCYVGRNPVERGRHPEDAEDAWSLEQINEALQHFAYVVHNNGPSTDPSMRGTGLSRLEHWDLLMEQYGPPAILTDPRDYFHFLPRKEVTRTPKGVAVNGERYDSPLLWKLPPHLIDANRRLEVIYDERRLESIWIEDPVERVIHQIDNVLRDYTDAPLVRALRRAAFQRGHLTHLRTSTARASYVHVVQQLLQERGQSEPIERDLYDWNLANRHMERALGNSVDSFLIGTDRTSSGSAHRGGNVDLDRPLPRREPRA